jgi:hypothetical protein
MMALLDAHAGGRDTALALPAPLNIMLIENNVDVVYDVWTFFPGCEVAFVSGAKQAPAHGIWTSTFNEPRLDIHWRAGFDTKLH